MKYDPHDPRLLVAGQTWLQKRLTLLALAVEDEIPPEKSNRILRAVSQLADEAGNQTDRETRNYCGKLMNKVRAQLLAEQDLDSVKISNMIDTVFFGR